MSLSYPELWFLEGNVTRRACWAPFQFLPDSQQERDTGRSAFWNGPAHGLTLRQIGEVLLWLYQNGDIRFQFAKLSKKGIAYEPGSAQEISSAIEVDYSRFEENGRWRTPAAYHWYTITEKGFRRWEDYAQPDWSRYRGDFDEEQIEAGKAVWTQVAMTESFARELLAFHAIHFPVEDMIFWPTATMKRIAPWKPIHFKVLPEGVKLSVQVEMAPRVGRIADRNIVFEHLKWLPEYSRRASEIKRWYERGIETHPHRPQPSK